MSGWLEQYDDATRELEKAKATVVEQTAIRETAIYAMHKDGMPVHSIVRLTELRYAAVYRMIRNVKARFAREDKDNAEVQG